MNKTLASLALAASTLLLAPQAGASIVVSLVPDMAHYDIGQEIVVDVRISGLGSEILSAFDLNVLFDPTIIGIGGASVQFPTQQFGGADPITGLPNYYFSASFDPGNHGGVGGSLLLDDELAAVQTDDSFTFAFFTWTADANGVSFLNFGADTDFDRNVVGRDALSLNASFEGACIAVGTGVCNQAIPEPASYALVSVALAGALLPTALRRRRNLRAA